MGRIVYHGTWSGGAPHEYEAPFHAGTMQATDDRAYDQVMAGEVPENSIKQVHAYEISKTAPISRTLYNDPDAVAKDGYPAPRRVPQDREDKIYRYKNIREDRGSTSYVIPAHFVGNHVKHLGVQFQRFHGDDNYLDTLLSAASTMVGGKYKAE
jgi:hypothetical protein